MNTTLILSVIIVYFGVLFIISWITSKGADQNTFFTGNKSSPWYVVSFGMIGASLSGVTFLSVPGWVVTSQFSYMQMVLGYLVGYAFIAMVLLPLYYKMNLISIYGYLKTRFGNSSYKTGAIFFLISRIIGASFRLYLVVLVMDFIIKSSGFEVPFAVPVFISIALIYLYTFRGGIKTVVWTDTLQTLFMLLAAGLTVIWIKGEMNWDFGEMVTAVKASSYSQVFFFEGGANNFFSKFISGAFIALVMTGLDQDMMQKNLTCRNTKDAQKNMFSFSIVLVFVNLGFLMLGALLFMYATGKGILSITELEAGGVQLQMINVAEPIRADELFHHLALSHFPPLVGIFFILGFIASAYSSADSALTALTTSFCVDILNFQHEQDNRNKVRLRNYVHIGFSVLIFFVILVFRLINDQSVISAIFTAAGYTYGPLLGLYAFGLATKLKVKDAYVPIVCILSPILSFLIAQLSNTYLGYKIGFELLILNGFLTFIGLLLIIRTDKGQVPADQM